MGNRGVITTEDKEIGVYLHWNGGMDSVRAFLTYCRLHGYRKPEEDDYGWARLCQVVSNFVGEDGCSVGIDKYENLDRDNGDNGVYIIKNWTVVGREYYYGSEQDDYDLLEMLLAIDDSMPENHRIGGRMIKDLMRTNETVSSFGFDYFYDIRRSCGRKMAAFEEGSTYGEGNNIVIKKILSDEKLLVEYDGAVQECDIYHWRDGRESIFIRPNKRNIFVSSSK